MSITIFNKVKEELASVFKNTLTIISPVLNTRYNYYRVKGKQINLKNPREIEEKLSWLKLFNYADNELVIKCADKLKVRDYIVESGYGHLLNDLYYVFDSIEEIDPEKLPNQFALKWNTGAGGNFICSDKATINLEKELQKLNVWKRKWDRNKPYLASSEMHYKYIKPQLICEKYLSSNGKDLPVDYKIYCFNGVPKAILVMEDRDKETKGVFMDPEWHFISNVSKYNKMEFLPEKPQSLDEMLEAASVFSRQFPFVRVDFFEHENQPIFGELTFTPGGSLSLETTDIDGVPMGDLLDISVIIENII